MAAIFSQILNMSMTGSVVILLVLLARVFLKRSPKIFSYALWSVVLFRLLCPVAFTAPVSVLDVVEPEQKETSDNTSIVSYIPATVNTQADFIMVQPEEQPVQTETASQPEEQLRMTPMHGAALVWAAGMVGMMLYSLVQYLTFRRNLVGSLQLKGNIYLADPIDTAFVVGLVQPRIYLPSGVPENERSYILAHEQHHIRRLDHVVKLLAYLALCIHWFNPLVWLAFVLAGKDMEMSCDEAVIQKLGPEIRADYSASLLRLATHKKILSGMPLAFGEGDTKGRVLNMAKWKKPARWVAAICAMVCLCVVVVCAFNPEEGQSIEELTRRTSDTPVGTGIGDLYFTYPAGLTSELREVENWTIEDRLRSWRGLTNRNPYDHFFLDNGVDFGGVVGFLVPEDREIKLEELNLPPEWVGLDYISGSASYPYAEREYTLIKDGKDYIQMYLYTYSGRGYFLWFYTEKGNPQHKEAILNSVEIGSSRIHATNLKRDEIVSLGQFNITIPKGYGYARKESEILEISRKDLFHNSRVVGCVTAIPNPNLPLENDGDLVKWVEAIGIDLGSEGKSFGYSLTDEMENVDIYLNREELVDGKRVMAENHYIYIAGDIVYDLRFDALQINWSAEKAFLDSVWIKEAHNVPAENKWVTEAGVSPVQIGKLPDGYNYGFDGDQNIVFAWGDSAVGGVKSYPIPVGLYDPEDEAFLWLEEMGIPDYEDPNLTFLGGITSGDNGWAAEFADAADGAKRKVHRRHTFQVVEDTLYDIWFDMLKISFDNASEIRKAVSIPQPQEETESYMPTIPGSEIATDIQLIQYGDFRCSLPSGLKAAEENGTITLAMEDKTVGGIALRHPEQPNSPDAFSESWQAAMGVPEASDPAMGYIGGGSLYADYEITYFPDMPVNRDDNGNIIRDEMGTYVLENEVTHYFFANRTDVYDLWLYVNRLPKIPQEALLKSCCIEGVTDMAAKDSAKAEEEAALAKCRAVLEAVQTGSYHVTFTRSDKNAPVDYETEFLEHGEDWLMITASTFTTGESEQIAHLYANGRYFSNQGHLSGNERIWEEVQDAVINGTNGLTKPWLASFLWSDDVISYQGTMERDGISSVMLRIDEAFPYGYINDADYYFVSFSFDSTGRFADVFIQGNVFLDNAFTERESIVSLDSVTVNAEIQREYENAIAFHAVNEMGAGAIFDLK